MLTSYNMPLIILLLLLVSGVIYGLIKLLMFLLKH